MAVAWVTVVEVLVAAGWVMAWVVAASEAGALVATCMVEGRAAASALLVLAVPGRRGRARAC